MNKYGPITVVTGQGAEPIEVESLKITVLGVDCNIYDLGQYGMGGKYKFLQKEGLLKLIAETLDKQFYKGNGEYTITQDTPGVITIHT